MRQLDYCRSNLHLHFIDLETTRIAHRPLKWLQPPQSTLSVLPVWASRILTSLGHAALATQTSSSMGASRSRRPKFPANSLRYTPSIVLASLAIALFFICSILHIFQVLRYRAWSFAPLTFACVLEVLGYVFRTLSSQKDPYSKIWFILQYFLIVVAPVFISASIYVCITRLIHWASKCGYQTGTRPWLKPKLILWAFITIDAVTTVLQVAGAALIGTLESDGKDPKKGNNILLAGLSIQTFAFTFFIALLVSFHVSLGHDTATKHLVQPKNSFILALLLASLLIYLRTIFRLSETAQGVFGHASTHEAFFGALEFAPVITAVSILAYFHPGRWLKDSRINTETHVEPGFNTSGVAESKGGSTPV